MTGTRSCISARSERLLPASAAVRSERDALKAAIGAALSEFTLRPHTDVLANKMLHAAQMAAMRKLRRSVVTIGERQEWAVRDDLDVVPTIVALHCYKPALRSSWHLWLEGQFPQKRAISRTI